MTQPTTEQIIRRLETEYPYGVTLRYVDYRDDLSENPDVMNAILQGDHDLINDKIDAWWDTRDTIENIIREVFFPEEYEDNDSLYEVVSERCYNNDDSDPIAELIKNTNNPLAYYDTGIYFEDPQWMSIQEMKTECIQVCRKLGVHTKYASKFLSIYREAYHGGSLVFILNLDLSDFYNKEAPKYIKFNGETKVGIIDFSNGSGDYEEITLSHKDICFKYDHNRMCLDSEERYGIQDIFGCFRDVGSSYSLSNSKSGTTYCRLPGESSAKERKAQEKEYKKVYLEGGCSYFDSDISRHRKAFYRNEPMACGHKCPDCGRYWAD